MTEKEKVKAYDNAIERAKKWQNITNTDKILICGNRIIEEIFPELNENKDEMIKTAILNHLKIMWENGQDDVCGIHIEDVIAWIEKQRDKDKLIQELGEYKVKYIQEVLEKYINCISNKDDERLRKTAIAFLKDFAEKGYENAVECIDCFEEGAEWSDGNPITLWINVNDSLPNDETKLYIIYCEVYNKNGDDIENKHYEIYLANFDKETSSWFNVVSYENYFFDVLYWMEIPELPKDMCSIISEY